MMNRARLLVTASLALFSRQSMVGGTNTDAVRTLQLQVPGAHIRAFVSPEHGADLSGLEVVHAGRWTELLYRGMDYRPVSGWPGKAPILWPAVGRNYFKEPDDGHPDELGWRSHGTVYPLPIHGFARDQAWQLLHRGVCQDSAYLVLRLRDNAATRTRYPYGFELTSEYRLWRNTLLLRQTVRAATTNAEPMPFSIGNHLTLHIPLLPGSDARKTTLATPATQQVLTDAAGRPTGVINAVDYAQPRLLSSFAPLTPISLSGYAPGPRWTRIADPSGFQVLVWHVEDRQPSGTPVLFNLWGDPEHGYFAPEPWVGKQNSLASGDGLIHLAPGELFHWTVGVEMVPAPATMAVPIADAAPTCAIATD